ncbi:MAG TPA: hypothetical protein VJ111_08035 [Chitinophagaceae bacterium]|nr:hypothetical protein [Chitinophagaceae bacterium]
MPNHIDYAKAKLKPRLVMRYTLIIIILLLTGFYRLSAQVPVSLKKFSNKNGAKVIVKNNILSVSWPVGKKDRGLLVFNFDKDRPLFQQINLSDGLVLKTIVKDVDPVFLLTVGKRDLISQNGWNIFFDKVPLKPHQSHVVKLDKKNASVSSAGSRTIITIEEVTAPHFSGVIEVTLYNDSPLINIAAVMSTTKDSTAILYDAGLVSKEMKWENISWSDVYDKMQNIQPGFSDSSKNEAVKYRTIIGQTKTGSIAVFPAPHQYFYPLDEAFNLKFTWYGNEYRKMVDGYGIGIRQDLYGDNRFVPWFNAPPQTQQRLNFFCLLNAGSPSAVLEEVKRFTHNDRYVSLPGYKTMASHFHNEFVMKTVLAGKPVPDTPNFIKVFKNTGIDIVHLGEFHYTAHPRGPDEQRLKELQTLFQQCRRLSDDKFLLLPGEEPNEFLGGHWLQFFPKPVYWIMSRKQEQPFVTQDSIYGTVYRISNATEMLELLNKEKGLAWTAHPRTKGSTGYPDKYKNESFFKSDRFLGAAWKPIPADLSLPKLGKRVLDLMDDMNNWGENKKILAEADLFTIEPENEMYAHLNVNYLKLDKLPSYNKGWQTILDAMQKGSFFSSTGEVLISAFTVNNKNTGDTVRLNKNKKATIAFKLHWTFPLQFAEIISGDGKNIYRHKINLDTTLPFGEQIFRLPLDLADRKWVRLEAWDIAANGAFTQTIWLK